MKKCTIVFIIVFVFLLILPRKTVAVYDPLSAPNNKVGVHILFPEEIRDAAALVNGNDGEWGYVTIPIQAGDRNLAKWQTFMDNARKLKVIPIIRLATEGDYFNTKVWRKPNVFDLVDFANFLHSLNWPTKNRYIIVFNEVNRSDEWGGEANPQEYAELLDFAIDAFKSRSENFFIITAGLDNASANVTGLSIEPHAFLRTMEQSIPGIFQKLDGLASHSYPNPSFAQPPTKQGKVSVASFRFEQELIRQIAGKNLPVFITETGWSSTYVSDETAATFFSEAFTIAWSDTSVVAVTPFLLRAYAGPFTPFSLLRQDGSNSHRYDAIYNLPKEKGAPMHAEEVLGEREQTQTNLASKSFPYESDRKPSISLSSTVLTVLRWMLKF